MRLRASHSLEWTGLDMQELEILMMGRLFLLVPGLEAVLPVPGLENEGVIECIQV
jgi:hypothetical protein